jgi:hypothetical protein
VFDRGVSGATAIDVLARVRPPQGADVAPALFLSGGGGVALSAPGERRLDPGASDATIARAVDELIASTPRPEPRVMPPIEEIDVAEIVGTRPGVTPVRRRRSGPGVLGPLAALALLLAAIAAYSAIVAGRTPSVAIVEPLPTAEASELPATLAPTPADLAAQSVLATATTTSPAAEPTARPIGGPVLPAPSDADPPAAAAGAGRRGTATGLTEAADTTTTTDRTTLGSNPDPVPSADPAPSPDPLVPAPPPLALAPPSLAPASPPLTGLEGRITDASTGHALPGAVVAYRGPAAGQTTSGGDGRYRVTELPAGAYEVVAVAPGYAQSRNRAGVVAETLTTDNLALAPMDGASVAPFLTVADRRSGQPVAAYGYPVRPGDTLRAIAERAGTTLDEILALNRIDDADRLEPGQVLYLPASTFGQK